MLVDRSDAARILECQSFGLTMVMPCFLLVDERDLAQTFERVLLAREVGMQFFVFLIRDRTHRASE